MLQDHADIEGLLTVGSPAVIHTHPGEADEKRYPTVIRGWYQGNYILLDRPLAGEDGETFTKSQRSLVRFLSEGRACGFPCTLMKAPEQNQPYIRVSWPRKIESVGIRKHERVDLFAPCVIARDGEPDLEAHIVDLSAGGCGVKANARIAPQTPARISFNLPDGSAVTEAKATVRSAKAIGQDFLLGLMFDEEEEARITCDFFVTTTMERVRGGGETKRALLLESEDVRSDGTRAKLEEKGYRVVTVTCIVDAFFSLRMAKPSCFWIGAEQAELPAVEICRILRKTNGFSTLPLYVIGGDESNLEDFKQLDVVYASSIAIMDKLLDEA